MSSYENDGLNEKLNQDNTEVTLNMNHLSRCSRQANSTHWRLVVPSEHLSLMSLGCHRVPPFHLTKENSKSIT
ncbi:hypothetical protein BS78_01G373600, partial [Paspalum vaginatum]